MALQPGVRLGPYQIHSAIGAGGMGEVWKARDTTLGRDVALKILPDHLALDPERLARFKREAQILASLNHPNIAAIYGLERQAGQVGACALVLELVEGPTLADRIGQGPIPVDEALRVARQIAEALEAAHEQGIVHRDLKPANIKVRSDGAVKVLDFGLAKAVDLASAASEASQSPTLTSPSATQAGAILGTAAYMSPEQARGRAVDKRSDIWAFGCVLYEMLSGRAAFLGETFSDTVARILDGEPDWGALPEATPSIIRRLLRRCLEKDAKQRLRDIGDARLELREASSPERPAPVARAEVRRRRFVQAAVALLVAVAAAVLGWYAARRNPPVIASAALTRFAVELPPAAPLFDRGRGNRFLALSPDGAHLAFFAQQLGQETAQLWLRSLAQLESRLIAVTSRGFDPFFSPDGRWVGFFEGQQIKKVAVAGGEPLTICDLPPGYPLGASWGSDDTIFFTPSRDAGLWRVSAAGGIPQVVLNDKDIEYRLPQLLPDDRAVIFSTSGTGAAGRSEQQIQVQSLETGERRAVVQGIGAFFVNDYLVFGRGTGVLAVPFSLDRLETIGMPVPLLDRVYAEMAPQMSVSEVGSLAYVPTLGRPVSTLTWVDRNGVEQPVPAPARAYFQPRLAPDGRRLAVPIEQTQGSASSSLWTYDFERDVLTSVTPGGSSSFPVWNPDAIRLTFSSSGIYWKASDGSGAEERLLDAGLPLSWSPDGRTLTIVRTGAATQQDIWMLPMDDSGKPQKPYPFVQTRFAEGGQVFSPDGRFVAYVSSETGRNEVYVRQFSEAGGRWQISTDGGNEVVWPRNGRELFYRNGDAVMAVEVTTRPTFAAGKPRRLFVGPYAPSTALWSNYDVAPDGRRFLMIEPVGRSQARPQVINVVLNWPEELKGLASPR